MTKASSYRLQALLSIQALLMASCSLDPPAPPPPAEQPFFILMSNSFALPKNTSIGVISLTGHLPEAEKDSLPLSDSLALETPINRRFYSSLVLESALISNGFKVKTLDPSELLPSQMKYLLEPQGSGYSLRELFYQRLNQSKIKVQGTNAQDLEKFFHLGMKFQADSTSTSFFERILSEFEKKWDIKYLLLYYDDLPSVFSFRVIELRTKEVVFSSVAQGGNKGIAEGLGTAADPRVGNVLRRREPDVLKMYVNLIGKLVSRLVPA